MCVIWNECASIKTASNQFAPFTRHRTQPINVSAGAATKGVEGEVEGRGQQGQQQQSEANPVCVCVCRNNYNKSGQGCGGSKGVGGLLCVCGVTFHTINLQ